MIENYQKPTKQERAIVETVAYFSLFDYPLTPVEIANFVDLSELSLAQIINLLESSAWLKERVEMFDGFVFLIGKKYLVETRLARYVIADKKIKKVRKALRLIASVPSVRAIMLCNNIGQLNASSESDIDVLLVVRNGRLWLTRFLLLIITELGGVRIHGNEVQDKLCLSFYVSDEQLSLEQIALPEGDVYLKYWLATLLPVYDEGMYRRLVSANQFLRIPHLHRDMLASRYLIKPIAFLRPLFGCILKGLQPLSDALKKFQIRKMSPQKQSLAASQGSEIVLHEAMLKFHDNDRRWLYLQQWNRLNQEICQTKN